jgi:hypothetical protein
VLLGVGGRAASSACRGSARRAIFCDFCILTLALRQSSEEPRLRSSAHRIAAPCVLSFVGSEGHSIGNHSDCNRFIVLFYLHRFAVLLNRIEQTKLRINIPNDKSYPVHSQVVSSYRWIGESRLLNLSLSRTHDGSLTIDFDIQIILFIFRYRLHNPILGP